MGGSGTGSACERAAATCWLGGGLAASASAAREQWTPGRGGSGGQRTPDWFGPRVAGFSHVPQLESGQEVGRPH